jgi:hypothetical protein
MKWAAAVIIETSEELLLRAMYIRASSRYEALGKAYDTACRLWPGSLRVHVNICPADERHLINDPEQAEIEPNENQRTS